MPRSPYSIQIVNKSGAVSAPAAKLKKHTAAIMKAMNWGPCSISILLVDDREIARINRKHLNHTGPTDVITFSQLDEQVPALIDGRPFLGDIVISTATARRQASEYQTSFVYELCFYICHGLLHIAGFEDRRAKDRERMLAIQVEILKAAGIENDYAPRRKRRT